MRDLLRDAERVLPGIAEYALVETAAGLRPGSPDNLPLIGALGPAGLLVATGHHRNGMLLAPLTADAVVALLRGGHVPAPVRAADPARLSRDGEEVATCTCGSTVSRASWRPTRACSTRSPRSGAPRTGVAVAVDGEVVPRADWPATALADGARVEVLTAVQGG